MLSIRSRRPALRKLVALGAVGLGMVAVPTVTAVPASASPQPPASSSGSIPLGDGYMGAGYLADGDTFAPDNRHVDLTPESSASIQATMLPGIDVSHYQGSINWSSVKSAGIKFAYIKATESTTYKDPNFNANYLNAYNAKVIRGAYHFARPNLSSGAAQATYFAGHGGAWSRDNLTLPGMLDLEGGCYGKSASAMQSWILDFYNTYKAKTGRDVVIYTSASWWNSCTGGWSGMSARSPLFTAHWTSAASPTIPKGFPYWTFWQYTDSGSVGGISGAVDRDRFNGDATRLLALANNT
ncbi:GH25 family lysozyme [Streptomyces drozdowiczii]|uniref:Lysozyme n=1 Tax=Streptomyces drozdowiczii TaxID=202862 RepID=A0ABY6PLT4_9ACTN|nr:GH25 family lysozyme [Streptomyces drozdowiczii]MCX0247740.1 lysozyme [Streptomyces drozdowiczii]UZK52894.1 lysozyme [Streptomyces drozdowiczii]